VIDRLHGLALGDRDIARDGDGDGGDDDDGDDEARGIASAAGSPSAADATSPTSARLARVPPGAAVAALAAAFEAGERYADVRSAVVSALPRGEDAADFLVSCVEHTAASSSAPSSVAAPLTQLLLEALQHSCATTTPRRVFATTDGSATRVECATARTRAAKLVARAVCVDDDDDDDGNDDGNDDDNDNDRWAEDPSSSDAALTLNPKRVTLEPRAVARLLTAVGLDMNDLTAHRTNAEHRVVAFVGACLGRASSDPASAVAGASIAKHFSLAQFATPSALDAWEAQGHGPIADGIAATLTEAQRQSYVKALRNRHPSRTNAHGTYGQTDATSPADRADRRFRRLGLPPAFPEEERAGREGALRRLAAAGRWDVAEQLAGEDARARALVRGLRDAAATVAAEANGAGWSEWAAGGRHGAPVRGGASIGGGTSTAEAAEVDQSYLPRHMRYLPLDLPRGAVRWADDARSLAAVVAALSLDAVIGIDSEWVPDGSGAGSGRRSGQKGSSEKARRRTESPTALLQLSGERCVALLDATKLGRECPAAFAAALRGILSDARQLTSRTQLNSPKLTGDSPKTRDAAKSARPPAVVGFGVADDLRRLAGSYPGEVADAIRAIPRVLCLQRAAIDRGHGSQPGLSSVCQALLGQPLDKRERCGDWSRRPLTESQVAYGAQDARVLLRILPGLLLGESRAREPSARADAADLAFELARPAAAFIGDVDVERTVRIADVERTSPTLRERFENDNIDDNVIDDASLTPLTPADVAAALADRLPSAGGDPTVIELGVDAGPAALGDGIAPDAAVKSMGVMVAGDTTVVGMDPVARALGASGRGGGSNGSSGGSNGGGSNGARKWEPVVTLLRGVDRADLRAIASHFGVARRHARLATPDECVRVFGFPPGSMPPLGHRAECPTLMDAALTDPALREKMTAGGFVYPGAGAPHLVFRCLPAVLERATAATTLPVAESSVAREAARRAARSAAARSAAASSASADVDSRLPDWGLGVSAEGSSVTKSREGSASPREGTALREGGSDERRRRFVADGSLGRLARWLRCLGVDAEHVPVTTARGVKGTKGNNNDGQYGALLALAQRDDRVILTKDRRLLQRKDAVGAFLVTDDDPKRQLASVSAHFGLAYRRGSLLTRCAKCNGAVERRCTPEEVAANGSIPAKVKASTNEFWACGRCEKVYWVGPKSHLAMSFIDAEIAPTVTRARDEARLKLEEEAVLEEALGGNPWPRRTGPNSREG